MWTHIRYSRARQTRKVTWEGAWGVNADGEVFRYTR